MQQFGYCEPHLVINLLSVYSTALYGSSLWQLDSEEHLKLNRSWNTAVKIIWDLPHSTHTRFLESLSPVPHLESVLAGRYIGFINNLSKSNKSLLKLLYNSCCSDLGSLTGQNLYYLLQKYNKDSIAGLMLDKNTLKKARVYQLSENEHWKTNIIEELSLIKKGQLENNFDEDFLEEILDYVCTD